MPSLAVFCIIIVVVVVVVVTAVGIIWPEVPDHGLGDRGLIFVRNFLSSPWALGALSLMSSRYWRYVFISGGDRVLWKWSLSSTY